MSVLGAIGGGFVAPTPPSADSGSGSGSGAGGASFSSFMAPSAPPAATVPAEPARSATDAAAEPPATDGGADTAAPEGKVRDHGTRAGAGRSSRDTDAAGDAADGVPPMPAQATQGAAEDTAPADAAPAGDGAWPPPGLASLLFPTLAPATAAAPLADAGTLAAAAAGTGSAAVPQAAAAVPAASPAGPAAVADGAGGASAAAATGFALPESPASGSQALPADLAALAAAAEPEAPAADGSDTGMDIAAPTSIAQAAAPLTAARDTAAAPAVVPQLHQPAFADDVGTHLQWMADQKIGHAQIRISPDDLGPVEVRLRLDGDKVSADFASAQPEVRQALEQSLPRLREMLGQHGLQLAHAGVGQQSRQHGDGSPARADTTGGGVTEADTPVVMPAAVMLRQRGLLDAYA